MTIIGASEALRRISRISPASSGGHLFGYHDEVRARIEYQQEPFDAARRLQHLKSCRSECRCNALPLRLVSVDENQSGHAREYNQGNGT